MKTRNLASRVAVVMVLITSVGFGAVRATPGGDCSACVRDVMGNRLACKKVVAEPEKVSAGGCCGETAGRTAAEAGVPYDSVPDDSRGAGPAKSSDEGDSHDCAGKCQQCCAAPGQAPLVAPQFVVYLDAADSAGALALTHAAAPLAGVHVSVFHPPRD